MKYIIRNKTFTNQNFHFSTFSMGLIFQKLIFMLIKQHYLYLTGTNQRVFNFMTYSIVT